ncbi:hypothetical protein [Streptomyces sp. NPDC051016]|uniref:hypothetical protein n=1 Tax=Streptomyces sp. NPDC051016 TaxID=3365638 RepID=UPI0037898F22
MPESFPVYAGGQRITGSLLRSGQIIALRKTADTNITASTTTTADPHLQFTADANTVYTWWGWVKYSADTAGDLNLDFSAPVGALGEWFGVGAGNPVTGASATPTLRIDTQGASGYFVRTETTDVTSARSFGGLGSGITLGIQLNGTLRMAATGGTFSLDWAQGTSSATATTLYTDSWINLQRVA